MSITSPELLATGGGGGVLAVNVCCGDCLLGWEILLKMLDLTRSGSWASFSFFGINGGAVGYDVVAEGREGVPEREPWALDVSMWCF